LLVQQKANKSDLMTSIHSIDILSSKIADVCVLVTELINGKRNSDSLLVQANNILQSLFDSD